MIGAFNRARTDNNHVTKDGRRRFHMIFRHVDFPMERTGGRVQANQMARSVEMETFADEEKFSVRAERRRTEERLQVLIVDLVDLPDQLSGRGIETEDAPERATNIDRTRGCVKPAIGQDGRRKKGGAGKFEFPKRPEIVRPRFG